MNSYSVNFCSYTIGCNAYENVANICKKSGKKVLLIGGEKGVFAGKPFLMNAVNKSQKENELEMVAIIDHIKECNQSNIDFCVNCGIREKVDMVFGMGGGKAIDTAKCVANLLGVDIYTFPTIAATCAATTALSVVYHKNGTFDRFEFFDAPAKHTFIDMDIIAGAPAKYLQAGMGDTIGKHFECHFATRGDNLLHSSMFGREVSNLCFLPLLEYGKQGLEDCKNKIVSEALRQVVLANIVSTGMVSLMVLDQYNCALAHALYYGLVLLPGFEECYLHGNVVAYGVLVQLAVDGDIEMLKRVKLFLQEIQIPTTLGEMKVEVSRSILSDVLRETVTGPDLEHIPYTITEDMVFNGILTVEKFKI